MTSVEDALVQLAGAQALEEVPEAVAEVNLEEVREAVDAIVQDEEKTVDEQVAALEEIQQTLEEALPEALPETADVEAVQAQLDAAEAEVEKLTGELAQQMTTIDALNAQIAELGEQAETDATQLADLQSQLEAAMADAEAKTEALETAQAEYAKELAAAEAYVVQRAPASGEAHIATAVDNVIDVAADGVTADWQYTNSDLSGNVAVLSLVLDSGETVFLSNVKPGEALDSVTLDTPLAPGTYKALAVTTVVDEKGEAQLTTRVPVTLNVAG